MEILNREDLNVQGLNGTTPQNIVNLKEHNVFDSFNQLLGKKDYGLSIIPTTEKKVPYSAWSKYQLEIAPIESWYSHYINNGTVGVITGKVSRNLEIIDIDLKNDKSKTINTEFIDKIPVELMKKLIVQSTPSKGYHFIYRCPDVEIETNQKLARETDKSVIIETRGEGGYFCTSKVNNKVLQGTFDLEKLNFDIPEITKKERDFLLETARSLTRYVPPVKASNDGETYTYQEPAINAFNQNYNILELFKKHGWNIVKEDDEKVYLLRDGSTASHSGYYTKTSKTFVCFSTSTQFSTAKPYNHFQILQLLEGKDDYRTTLRLLSDYGFPVNLKSDRVTSDDIAAFLNSKGVRYDTLIQDLTINGKIIEEMEYNTLFIDLKKHFAKEISRSKFEETIKSDYIEKINPLMDFIIKNIHRKPVGTFEKWFNCIELKNKRIDKHIMLKYLKKWYVGLIAQALDYEFPNEFFLTMLSTEQGIGKTTFLRDYTLPKELHTYRKEHSLTFDDDFKVIMSQSIMVIDDEMDGRTYNEEKTFKTVLSTKELTMRRKYDRRISTIKRRCSFAGSGNHLSIVREKNNRRIIPIEVEKFHFEKLEKIDLVDLFMEAYNLLTSGYIYSFQMDNKKELQHLYADYIQNSDLDLIFDEYINQPQDKADCFYITNLDLINVLLTKFPSSAKRINTVAIGKLMSENGYETSRKGANKTVCYTISKKSKVVELIGHDTSSWQLTHEKVLNRSI